HHAEGLCWFCHIAERFGHRRHRRRGVAAGHGGGDHGAGAAGGCPAGLCLRHPYLHVSQRRCASGALGSVAAGLRRRKETIETHKELNKWTLKQQSTSAPVSRAWAWAGPASVSATSSAAIWRA